MNIAQNDEALLFARSPMTPVRHFRQVVFWPLQLLPLKPGVPVQRHSQALEDRGPGNPWIELRDEIDAESREIRERYYNPTACGARRKRSCALRS